ncbi:hypothetical protein [Halalkalicoccus subterraneus]|uniref:hypothetical protein n=1 Tax=Halalkalicoccus subterraneus TaxID=2675002 RepID=UPI000EFBE505|nr:hypothetical protein [Halalkalicoccus subterraneus]
MSANDRSFDEKILEAKALLENHDDGEYEALSTSAKVNYQEALEFLSRLESSLETAETDERDSDRTSSIRSTRADDGEDTEIEFDTDLESTMGDDGDRVGPFGGDDVVVYDPNDDEGWLSMRYDATIPLETMR